MPSGFSWKSVPWGLLSCISGRISLLYFTTGNSSCTFLVVTIFTAIIGAPLYYITDTYLQHASPFIGVPMMILGLVLIGIGFYIKYSRALPKIGGLSQMRFKHYVIVGIAQGIAALPGVSRSGMTVSTMLVMGVKQDQAFRLSYLAYIPASLGAFGVSLLV